MAVALAGVLAALHLEDDDLVTLYQWGNDFAGYFGSVDGRSTYGHSVVIGYEQHFVKFYGLSGLSILDVLNEDLLAFLYLELLSVDSYDCVHLYISLLAFSPRGESRCEPSLLSPGDKLGAKLRLLSEVARDGLVFFDVKDGIFER